MGLTYTRILGIDPGVATGGIALLNLTSMTVSVGKIPAIVSNTLVKKGKRRGLMKKTNTTDVIALSKIFKNLVLTTRPICFLEKVQGWGGLDAGAKQYSIDKMKAHYAEIKTALTLSGLLFIEVPPRAWQSFLQLKKKGEDKKTRKKRYFSFAEETFQDTKVTLWNADALCIAEYGRRRVDDFTYIEKNITLVRATNEITD